jgi:hypothetical protein
MERNWDVCAMGLDIVDDYAVKNLMRSDKEDVSARWLLGI